MSTERLEIIITSTGGAAAAGQIDNIGKSATQTTSLLGFLRAALVAIAAAEIVTRFTELADVFTTVQNRLVLVTNGVQQANDVFQGLYNVAQQTRQPLEATTDVFTRIARSAEGQTLSFNQLLDVTKGLNETLLLSGAAGTRAKQGLTELAEGLGLGVLQGRQLRSLITDIPELANVIGKSVGVAGSQLFEFAQQNPGKLTPDVVIKSILAALPELQSQMSRAGLTFGQVFDRFTNSLETFLGRLNQSTGAAGVLDSALQVVATHFGQIVAVIAAFGAVVVFNLIIEQVLKLGSAFGLVLGIGQNVVALFGLMLAPIRAVAEAFGLLRLAVITNPLFLVGAVGIAGAVAAFFVFHDQIMDVVNGLGGLSGIFNTIVNVAASAVTTIIAQWQQLPAVFSDIGTQMGQSIINAFTKAKDIAVDIAKHPFASLTLQPIDQNGSQVSIPPALNNPNAGAAQTALDAFNKDFAARQATGTNPVSTGIDAGIAKAKQLYSMLAGISSGYGGTAGAGASGDDKPQSSGTIADLDELSKKTESLLSSISPLFAAQQKLAETAKAVGDAQKYFASESAFLDTELKGGAITADTYAQKTALIAQQQQIVAGATSTMALKVAGVSDAVDQYTQKFQVLNAALAAAPDKMQAINEQMSKDEIAFLDSQQDVQSGVARTFLKMQQQTADVAGGIEKALTGAFDSANDAVVQFVNTGKISITSLGQTIEDSLLKSALTGLEGDLGAGLGFGKASGGTSTIGALGNGILGLVGLGKSSGSSSAGGYDQLTRMLNVSGLPANAGMPVYVTNGALGGLGGTGTGSAASSMAGDSMTMPTGGSSADTGFLASIEGAFKSLGSEISSVLGSIGSGAAGAVEGAGSAISSGASYLSNLVGFASGGSFSVGAGSSMGAVNGIDNRLIAFRARDGETVSVTPQGQTPGGISQVFNISTPDANSFGRSQGQILSRGVVGASRAARRNNV